MSVHKARPDEVRPDPTQPTSTIMANGRHAVPHAEVDGKPILGGIQNATVEVPHKSEEENKELDKVYHEKREEMKKSQAKSFDSTTGEPKVEKVVPKVDPEADKGGSPTNAAEVKKNAENDKKPEVKPATPKVEEKK